MAGLQGRELAMAKTGLFMIANAMIVHEAIVASGALIGVQPLAGIDKRDPQGWLIRAWEKILGTDYRNVFEPALKILRSLPSNPALAKLLLDLAVVARKAVASRAVLRHDLAGRLYHTLLLRDVAKGLATYYTSIPAATILAFLAADQLSINWGDIEEVSRLRIADFACGSGTLLSAIYSEVMDRHIIGSKGRPSLSRLHKVLLEEVLYGFDVLEYAIHLTAASLVLRDPNQVITDTNTFIVPLGVHERSVHLGSLDMRVREGEVVFPRTRTLLGDLTPSAERRGVDTSSGYGLRMERPDIVLMNPPFARTGNIGKSSLFGHLPRADREEVLEELRRLGERIARKLGLREGFGRAGLAAYFLLNAYIASRDDAVLAFVLPRVFLSGSDWSSIRELLARKGAFKYIIVSDDPGASWAWSENTSLSEILMVYQKCGACKDNDTTVVYVRRRPGSALEAKIHASLIKSMASQLAIDGDKPASPTRTVSMNNKTIMYLYKVRGDAVRRVAGVNMNIVMGFHSSYLAEIAYRLYVDKAFMGSRLPLIPLKEYVNKYLLPGGPCKPGGGRARWDDCLGYDVAQVRRKCIGKGSQPVLFLAELSMDTFSSLKTPPSALERVYVPDDCSRRAGRLLIAGVARLWLPTIGVVAAYIDDPAISQVAWSIPLGRDEAKIQALWLNTTPGLIHFLSLRQDSKGGFIQLKKKALGDLLLIDQSRLSHEDKLMLLQLFDRFAGTSVSLGSIYTQLRQAGEMRGPRYEVDAEFLEILGVAPDRDRLLSMYRELQGETLFHRVGGRA